MPIITTTRSAKYSIGHAMGRALAARLVDMARPGATIVDNCGVVIEDRRKTTMQADGVTVPARRRTDRKTNE